jgi:hypothetical protein
LRGDPCHEPRNGPERGLGGHDRVPASGLSDGIGQDRPELESAGRGDRESTLNRPASRNAPPPSGRASCRCAGRRGRILFDVIGFPSTPRSRLSRRC